MSRERTYWLAWSQVSGVGPILLDRLDRHFDSLETAWNAKSQELLAIEGLGLQSVEKVIAARAKIDPEQLLERHTLANPAWWTRNDADYPRLLREIPSAPAVLYHRGQVVLAENHGDIPAIGIVGTRDPSEYGKKWARKISTLLAQQGFTVVSGMAQGIDTEAHRACLEAGGRTIAVVGTGVDIVYPPRNVGLAADICQYGLMVGEYPAGTPPDRSHFPARNRIIAGLSRVTIVIEAPMRSGALITAHQANDFGRDVYVLPGSIDNPNSIGCLELLSRGAQPILSLDRLLELLASIPEFNRDRQLQLFGTVSDTTTSDPPDRIPKESSDRSKSSPSRAKKTPDRNGSNERQPQRPPPDLAPDIYPIWLAVTVEPCSFDAIVDRCKLPTADVSSALIQLELIGEIVQLPGMRYQRETLSS
jgi:DNA processing protein